VSSWKFLSGLRILACLMVFSNVITVVCLFRSVFLFGCCYCLNNVCASFMMKRDMWLA
jgi:hypothetical protein